MRKHLCKFLAFSMCLCVGFPMLAQENTDTAAQFISVAYLDKVSAKAKKLEEKLDQHAEKAISQLQKQEERIKRKLSKIDSIAVKDVFASTENKYNQLARRLKTGTSSSYIPHLDTLLNSIKFLEQNPQLLSQAKQAGEKLNEALTKVKELKEQFSKGEDIKKFLKERKQFLKDQLAKFGFAKELKKLNKQVYYYSEQLNEYKSILKDHRKAERKALELLSKTKLFKDFMQKNSQLASIFRLPGDLNDPTAQANFAGLQTRAQVNSLIQQQISSGGPNAQQQFRQNLQQAQGQLNELKNRINQFGGGSSDDIMPEGFKPNDQKTKSFLKRLEYGINMQSQKARNYFPVTSDIGLSIGYKLNDRSIIGIGASYKIGWGQNLQNIKFTSQGMSLRSFIDWKFKGSFWITGGFEMNYRTEFNHVDELKELNAWQQSGLLGISKQVSLKSKFLKKTKLQLLWDFMSYHQTPATQDILFRIGYSF